LKKYTIKTGIYSLLSRFDMLAIVNPASQICEINATMPGGSSAINGRDFSA